MRLPVSRTSAVLVATLTSLSLLASCRSSPGPDVAPPEADAGAEAEAPKPRRPLAALWGAPMLVDENPDPEIVEVRLRAAPARAMLDDKEIDVLAFNGSVPGPILQARPGQRVIVHFDNALTEPTTVHWHGLRISDQMDGSPRIQTPVSPGGSFTYDFIVPEAASFWYHPHVNTHDQVERGLHGAIVIQDDLDPEYDLERSLVLDDVRVDASGAISPPDLSGLDVLTGRYGNVLLTNGKNAKFAVADAKKGQVERWRLVNVANARKMPLAIEGARARIIATDGGLLTKPVDVTGTFSLAVGSRLDLEVSYDAPGQAKLVVFDADKPVTMFAANVADSAEAPRVVPWPEVKPAVTERAATSAFEIRFDFTPGNVWLINDKADWMTPMLSSPAGSTVKMRILNNASGGVEHPFHLHGQFFRIVGDPTGGLFDTVQVPGRGAVEIIAYLDNPGKWMAHCHILEHAAKGMMAEIEVTGASKVATPPPASGTSRP